MTSKYTIVTFALLALFTAACGVEDDDTVNNPCPSGCCLPDCDPDGDPAVDPDPNPEPEYLACPFKTDGAYNWNFSRKYVSGAVLGRAVFFSKINGTWHNPQILDANDTGYMGMHYEVPAGVYRFSYVGSQGELDVCAENECPEAWAQYGSEEILNQLSLECLQFVDCNWNTETGCDECALKVEVLANGTIVGAGNMGDSE